MRETHTVRIINATLSRIRTPQTIHMRSNQTSLRRIPTNRRRIIICVRCTSIIQSSRSRTIPPIRNTTSSNISKTFSTSRPRSKRRTKRCSRRNTRRSKRCCRRIINSTISRQQNLWRTMIPSVQRLGSKRTIRDRTNSRRIQLRHTTTHSQTTTRINIHV